MVEWDTDVRLAMLSAGTTERCVAAPRSSRPAVAAVAEVAEAGSTILQRRLWFLVVFVDKLASAR